jgi:LPS export ABC transporter protein LptC
MKSPRFFCLSLCVAATLSACDDKKDTAAPLPAPSPNDNISMESFNTEYMYSDNARLTARMRAQHVIERNESSTNSAPANIVQYFEGGVQIIFYDAAGLEESRVNAQRGIYRQAAGLAELRGDVVVTNNQGDKLNSEILFWNEQKDSIYNKAFVRVQTPDKIITAKDGFRSDTKFRHYELRGVQGVIQSDEDL